MAFDAPSCTRMRQGYESVARQADADASAELHPAPEKPDSAKEESFGDAPDPQWIAHKNKPPADEAGG
ncbi:hypothetical protein [Kaistia adipata]|uniref:hypothetical protein n=1 Tax=Kaistia adipata TaxID=166954 RepID=UPI00146CDC84|nr:hypothetical protein [Kaistia adipata]